MTRRLWFNARLATMAADQDGIGVVEDGAVLAQNGRIVHAGPAADLPDCSTAERIDCQGRWITPGLIDCHTHLVYGGDRSGEFERRLAATATRASPAPAAASPRPTARPGPPISPRWSRARFRGWTP